MKYGLGENQLSEIVDIFRKYPEVEEAILFGSRAIGTYKEASDIDIAIKGKDVSVILATKIQSDLEDTYLPFFFDIISFPSITNQDLIKHINTKGISIYCAGWKKCKLGDVVNIIGGGTPKTTIDRYWGGDIPWVSIADIVQSNKYIHSTSKTITKEGLKNSSTRLLDERDIIISARGTIGAVAVLKSRMAFNQSCYGISAKKDFLDQEYLYYLLTNLITSFNQYSHGGVFDTITRKTFDSIEIYLPPLHKQKEIASILSCLDEKIDLLHRQNKTLESIAQTLFHQWFIKEADENWVSGTLSDEFEVLMGVSPPGESYNKKRIGVPFYQGSSDFGFRFPNDRIFTSNPKRIAQKNDVLISVRAPVGQQNQASEKCCIGRGVASIKYKNNPAFYSYTYYKLKSLNLSIGQFNDSGTVFGSITKNNLENLIIQIPSIELIEKFQDVVNIMDKKIVINTKNVNIINSLREKLIRFIFSSVI
jgi:type I restriction enzyme S subunit